MDYPSSSIQAVVEAFAKLPGIGKKTAFRLALHLLRTTEQDARALGQAILDLQANTRHCTTCGNLTDAEQCLICLSPKRQRSTLCVVAETQDLLAIERTGQYTGLYHVLGGVISPMDGIGPDQLNIENLIKRAGTEEVQEIIFALSTSMEGETTAFYLARRLEASGVRLSNIARGIPVGYELEFTDELTLARSLTQRIPYHNPLKE